MIIPVIDSDDYIMELQPEHILSCTVFSQLADQALHMRRLRN